MTAPRTAFAIRALHWTVGLVVLLESCRTFLGAHAGLHSAGLAGPLASGRLALSGAEIVSALLFLVPVTTLVGGYALLAIFALAIAIARGILGARDPGALWRSRICQHGATDRSGDAAWGRTGHKEHLTAEIAKKSREAREERLQKNLLCDLCDAFASFAVKSFSFWKVKTAPRSLQQQTSSQQEREQDGSNTVRPDHARTGWPGKHQDVEQQEKIFRPQQARDPKDKRKIRNYKNIPIHRRNSLYSVSITNQSTDPIILRR
jgi:hypothetical protein